MHMNILSLKKNQKFKFHQNAWFREKMFSMLKMTHTSGIVNIIICTMFDSNIFYTCIYNDYSYRVLTFIRLFVDKNTQISGIDMRLQSNRPKIMNLHASSIRLFWALTGPLAMSLRISESWYCWIYTLHCTVLSVSRLAPRGPYYFKFIFWI